MGRLPAVLACVALAGATAADPGTALSPDGRHRAVVTVRNGTQALEIQVTRTGVARTALRLGSPTSHPVFSPDGHFVAFFVQLTDGFVLTVSDLSGHSWPVAETLTADTAPAWSADAMFIYFMDGREGGIPARFRVTAGGTRLVRLTDGTADEN